MPLGSRVRLCLKDLYQQDIVEMIERETRRYELESIEHPDHPDFARAYKILWDVVRGPPARWSPSQAIRRFLLDDRHEPLPSGTFMPLLPAWSPRTARATCAGCVTARCIYNPGVGARPVHGVPRGHIYLLPHTRGTVLTYWLRIAPVELAVEYLVRSCSSGG
jgi:hypothetical protein